MNLLNPFGYFVYGVSTVASFLAGCLPLLVLAAAAAFGGASALWTTAFWTAAAFWVVSNLVTLIFIGLRRLFIPVVSAVGSAAMVIYCGVAIVTTLGAENQSPLVIANISMRFWVWYSISLLFNLVQMLLTARRIKQIREIGPK